MNKKDISIAILDVDTESASRLKAELETTGYSVFLFTDHEPLASTMKLRKIDVIIIECLTQKLSLDKTIQVLSKSAQANPIFIFTSFVLDKNAAKNAMGLVHSHFFYKKPLATKIIDEILNEKFSGLLEEELDPLQSILTQKEISNQERTLAIQSTKTLHGYDTPRIISYLMQSGFNGVLNLATHTMKPSEIHFVNGTIAKVMLDDPKSFFGALLVDKNFISLEALELILQKKSSKRIGERLVEANLVSPHVIDIVNAEQLAIRIGYLVQNASYDLDLKPGEMPATDIKLEFETYLKFTSDWLESKINTSWLKTFYISWMDHKILKTSSFADISPIYNLAPLNRMPKFSSLISQEKNISELLKLKTYKEDDLFAAIHLLILCGFIYFEKQSNPIDIDSQIDRLSKIKTDMDTQNHFEILGLSDKAKQKEIKKAYYELSKLFHPDRVAQSPSQEVIRLTNDIFSKISKSHEILSNEDSKQIYLKELEKGTSEKILESESLFEEAKILLKSNQAQKALPLLQKAISLRPPTSEIRLHYLWGKILDIKNENIETELTEVESDLNKIPPEDRHNSTYYFVKGLYYKQLGDLDQAEKSMKQALSMQNNNIEAKRELNIIMLQKKNPKNVDIMNADLKDVVGMLFKKKK